MDMKKMVSVTNRSSGEVLYKIPEHSIRRELNPGETIQVPYEELVWLSYQKGGRKLMENMLLIKEVSVTEALNMATEPEYFLNEQQVENLLVNGSVDELKDALDFAPKGVIDIIKDKAVSLPLYDTRKIAAIFEMTGFNVTAAIANNAPDPDEATESTATSTRRVQKPKYKVIEE